jgi:hypothetical protein
MTTIEELAKSVLRFYRENCEPHGIRLQDFLDRLDNQVLTELESE